MSSVHIAMFDKTQEGWHLVVQDYLSKLEPGEQVLLSDTVPHGETGVPTLFMWHTVASSDTQPGDEPKADDTGVKVTAHVQQAMSAGWDVYPGSRNRTKGDALLSLVDGEPARPPYPDTQSLEGKW